MENLTTPGNPSEFKPNIYPVMYWALAFGATAGILLFILSILARYITFVWFPVFLVGLVWGGYRNYHKQKREWQAHSGVPMVPSTPLNEFKDAVRDITSASRDLMAEQAEDQILTTPVATQEPAPTSDEDASQIPPTAPL